MSDPLPPVPMFGQPEPSPGIPPTAHALRVYLGCSVLGIAQSWGLAAWYGVEGNAVGATGGPLLMSAIAFVPAYVAYRTALALDDVGSLFVARTFLRMLVVQSVLFSVGLAIAWA